MGGICKRKHEKYEEGKAKWNYVDIERENSSEYSIVKGLKVGDKIIINNNFNLSHLGEVIIE